MLSLFSHCSNDNLHFFPLLLSTSVSSKLEWDQIKLEKSVYSECFNDRETSLHTYILPSFWQISMPFCPCQFWAIPYTVSRMEQIQQLPAQDHGWISPFCYLPEKIMQITLSKILINASLAPAHLHFCSSFKLWTPIFNGKISKLSFPQCTVT